MKVIDAFIFFNELDVLKMRLSYLQNIVDYFVICESDATFTGAPKPYYLDSIITSLSKDIQAKIIRIKLNDKNLVNTVLNPVYIPEIPDFHTNLVWKRERLQREAINDIAKDFSPNDFFILSDVDEIPKVEVVEKWVKIASHLDDTLFAYVLEQSHFQYNFFTAYEYIVGSVFSNVQTVKEKGCDLLRSQRVWYSRIKNCGWHFSWFGNASFIKNKLNSFAHQELNTPEYSNDSRITKSIMNQEDLFTSVKFSEYNFDNFPKNLQIIIKDTFSKEFYDKNTPSISAPDTCLDQFLAGVFNGHIGM